MLRHSSLEIEDTVSSSTCPLPSLTIKTSPPGHIDHSVHVLCTLSVGRVWSSTKQHCTAGGYSTTITFEMTFWATVIRYAVVFGIVALVYKVNKKPAPQSRANQQKELREKERAKSQKEKETKSRKAKSTGENSGNEAQKRKIKKEVVESAVVAHFDNSPDDHVDDREFARQLNNAKTGTNMMPKSEAGSRQKSVKLSKAKTSDNEEPRGPNGEHGSDGDDDLSSAQSPELNPTVSKSGDVSDMLETKPAGPSVLRLTESSTPQPIKPRKTASEPQQELTKKQRQNRAKKEAEKALNQEVEAQRRIALEKQRRRAREAEGRPAKDGSSTIYTPPPPKTSAWTSNARDVSASQPGPQFLPTFEATSAPVDPSPTASQENVRPAVGQASQNQATTSYNPDGLSESEQLRILLDDNAGWDTVKGKKSNKKMPKISSEAPASDVANGTSKFEGFETEA